ncbi:MAG TPA: glycoside hydrolase family 15 protein [Candidatus Dormibacteraeota bacterium]|nr:glycoside hydrolase family 15 protein [Candidatus Dormibacteraeota bacterium]
MPRDLPLGNGSLLVAFDRTYTLRDLYFPHVGQDNHLGGHKCRVGVWCEGAFSWIHHEGWQRDLRYRQNTLETAVSLRNARLGITLLCSDVVDLREPVLLRRFTLYDDRREGPKREIRLFLAQNFYLYGTEIGDTALYHPDARALVHYKGQRYLLTAMRRENGEGPDRYAVGAKHGGGTEGTFRDAEDGELSGNPIAQGAVDSVCGVDLTLEPGASTTVQAWLAAGFSLEEVLDRHERIGAGGWATMRRRTRDYWQTWVTKEDTAFAGLSDAVVDEYRRSLLVMRTQIDHDGAIVAANDSDITSAFRDTYSYVWPRDGALVAYALDQAGHHEPTLRFFHFCRRALSRDGYLQHKYNPDGSVASSWLPFYPAADRTLPIQEDETALVLWALWQHLFLSRNVDALAELYEDLVRPAAEFLLRYRDERTGLPLPSWDIWEERYGVHAWTVAAVYAGLRAAAQMARAFGEDAGAYEDAAAEIRRAAIDAFWDEETGRFARTIAARADGTILRDATPDCSIFGIVRFGLVGGDDPRAVATLDATFERLTVRTPVGGIARYEGDTYHRRSSDVQSVPGNPWFICSLWRAQWELLRARDERRMETASEIMEWVVAHAARSGVIAEQLDPETAGPLSVSPLTWSHAEFATTVVTYLDRRSTMTRCELCERPTYMREQRRVQRLHASSLGSHAFEMHGDGTEVAP